MRLGLVTNCEFLVVGFNFERESPPKTIEKSYKNFKKKKVLYQNQIMQKTRAKHCHGGIINMHHRKEHNY